MYKRQYLKTEQILKHGQRPVGSENLKKVREELIEAFEKVHWSVIEQTFTDRTPRGPREFTNLVIRYNPKGLSKELLWNRPIEGILGAHLDSKEMEGIEFVGADDAASAVGAIVEIATYLDLHNPQMASSLELVLFDGEEAFGESFTMRSALFGSRKYAQLVDRSYSQKPRYAMILDMIGHRDFQMAIPTDCDRGLVKDLFKIVKLEGQEDRYRMAASSIMDDHTPLIRMARIPSINLLGDFANTSWWHTSKDNFEIISKESLGANIRIALRMLLAQYERS